MPTITADGLTLTAHVIQLQGIGPLKYSPEGRMFLGVAISTLRSVGVLEVMRCIPYNRLEIRLSAMMSRWHERLVQLTSHQYVRK